MEIELLDMETCGKENSNIKPLSNNSVYFKEQNKELIEKKKEIKKFV